MALTAAGCTSTRPQAPIIPLTANTPDVKAQDARVDAQLPTDVLMLGEQHDAPEHQQIEQQTIAHLAARGVLAAVVLEMADSGATTAMLKPSASDEQVRNALKWNDKGWPWADYGPAVMSAVQAGVPVLGGNLPRAQMRDAMADTKLDQQLAGPALKAQQQLIRSGHCGLLPEAQITPMTRIQISKDITLANTIAQVALPGKVVVLLAGSGHVDRQLGVPRHLPSDLKVRAIRLYAGKPASTTQAFDEDWLTPAMPEKDYCAGLDEKLTGQPGMP